MSIQTHIQIHTHIDTHTRTHTQIKINYTLKKITLYVKSRKKFQ